MKKHYPIALLVLAGSICNKPALAQKTSVNIKDSLMMHETPTPVKKFYVSSGMDAAIFSTATMKRPRHDDKLGTMRFSYVINIGTNFNYDFTNHAGIFAGVNIKNIGFIEQEGNVHIKRRTYTIGIPLAIKFGNFEKKTFGFLGGGADVPFNYREKAFTSRSHKTKFNEWFSNRTPMVMPYVFAGVCVNPGITFKLQYYLNNYLNPDFTTNGIKPYAGYDVHLILFSVGFNFSTILKMHHK